VQRLIRRARRGQLRAIERVQHEADQLLLGRHPHELLEQLGKRFAMKVEEPPQRVVVRVQVAGKPQERHHLQARLFQRPRASDALHVAKQPDLQQEIRAVRRAPLVGHRLRNTQLRQVQRVDKVADEPHRVVRRHPLVERRRQQEYLRVVGAKNSAHVTLTPEARRTDHGGPRF
jgi:hypothetical protein